MKRRTLFFLVFVCVIASSISCKASKKCGCPTFGQKENAQLNVMSSHTPQENLRY
ncbi:MAG: hypothetical protein M9958_02475 [Chitinophagales bacterium]|nr:hypothetical protein [Chitinophagales bacterium]